MLSLCSLGYITFTFSICLPPLPGIFFSPQCICFLFHFFPDALSSFQLFSLPCFPHCSCWLHPSADPLKSVSCVAEGAFPAEAASCVGESAGQEGWSGSDAFRTRERWGFKGPDRAWAAIVCWAVRSWFSVSTFCKWRLLCFYPLFKKFLPPSCCSCPTSSPKLFCCLLQVTGQTLVGCDVDES